MIFEFNHPEDEPPADSTDAPDEDPLETTFSAENKGTMMLNATRAPQQIATGY